MIEDLLKDRKNSLVGGTTVVFNKDKSALYFSKEVIPFVPLDLLKQKEVAVYHHVGVYAYRVDVLKDYISWKTGKLELAEGLEQLRFLENNKQILCVESESMGQKFWELNNPEDLEKIEQFLSKMGIA